MYTWFTRWASIDHLASYEFNHHSSSIQTLTCSLRSRLMSRIEMNSQTFFSWINNRSILFDLCEFALLDCFQISLIFRAILIFWLWYRSSTSSRNYVNISFNTRFKFVFIWRWRFFYKFLIVVCSLSCSSKKVHFEIFHIIVVCVHSTLWFRVNVIFRALRLIYSWFDCRNRQSACDVHALSTDFWRRFANEINEDE
jgi:hypothetical protein